MSFNLIEAAKNLFTNELANNASNYFGESETAITKALSGIIPATVSGLADKASTTDGANTIIRLAQEYHQSGILNNLDSFFDSNSNNLLSKGTSLVTNLFGSNNANQLSSLVSNFSGAKSSTSSSLFGIALPVILALLGRHAANSTAGTTAITTALSSQSHHIGSALPVGLSLGSLFANSKKASPATVEKYIDSNSNSGSPLRFLLPLLLLALLAFLAWYFFKDGCNKKEDTIVVATDSSHVTNDSSLASKILGKIDSLTGDFMYDEGDTVTVTLPNDSSLTIGKYSTEYRLIIFLMDNNAILDTVKGNWFEFTNVHFKSGTSELTSGSNVQLKNIAAIFKAFPVAQFKLGGYTDSTGDDALNLSLSQKRADLVAATIKKLGAPASSIVDAKGYGKEWPIADNTTAEGRAMNRRVAVNVKAK